jgi:hypothetical protein
MPCSTSVHEQHVALALGDLLAADVEELVVHPHRHPRVHVEGALGLGHLVGVVHPHVVDAAGVDVEALAEVLHRHRRALDVPAGEPHAPRGVPLLQPRAAGRAELPQGEVGRVALVRHVLHPPGGLQVVEVEVGELGVAREGGHVEVDAVVDHVGVAPLLEGADQGDLLGDVVGGPGDHVGFEAAEAGGSVAHWFVSGR